MPIEALRAHVNPGELYTMSWCGMYLLSVGAYESLARLYSTQTFRDDWTLTRAAIQVIQLCRLNSTLLFLMDSSRTQLKSQFAEPPELRLNSFESELSPI